MGFKDFYFTDQEFIDFIQREVNSPLDEAAAPTLNAATTVKRWSAKRPEILDIWRKAQPSAIYFTPMAENPAGTNHSTYSEDGIRITGSWNFISGVIARLKELLAYENANTRLELAFHSVTASKIAPRNTQSYAFYIHLKRQK